MILNMHNLIVALCLFFHPVHVTLTSIDMVPGTDSLKVYMKINYDDFLRDCCPAEIKGTQSGNVYLSQSIITKYVDEKVKIQVNNKLLKGKLIRMDRNDSELMLNLFFRLPKNPESITIENTIMTTLYEDQSNMVMLRMLDVEEGFKLTPEINVRTFNLNKAQKTKIRK